jgi:chorismate--pyruvate lyase
MLKQRAPRAWLVAPGSLTKQLRRVCLGTLCVDVLAEGWVRVERVEARALGVRCGMWVWRREVVLRCEGQPYVHAVSFAERAGVLRLGLRRLGQRPLGEVLFKRGSRCEGRGVVRTFGLRSPELPWRRWSVFKVHGHRVLLYEDFMAAVPPFRA